MGCYVVDLGASGEDWSDVLRELQAVRALEERGHAEAVRLTMARLDRWTGDTA
jgi:hypothetical protein